MTTEHQTCYLLLRKKVIYLVSSELRELVNTGFLIILIMTLSVT